MQVDEVLVAMLRNRIDVWCGTISRRGGQEPVFEISAVDGERLKWVDS